MSDLRINFVSSATPQAEEAARALRKTYGEHSFEIADVVVVLGGDGLMLATLHRVINSNVPVYGMNFGSVGFLMNSFDDKNLPERIQKAEPTKIHPLFMTATDINGEHHEALALNEVSLFRSSYQAAKIEILVDGKPRIHELICDGVLLSTPAGSTAYNLSVHGPILPISSPLLALTPISPFRPRRWRGAILPNTAVVQFKINEAKKRPVAAVADSRQINEVIKVKVREDRTHMVTLLFDPGQALEERVLNEQFSY